MSRCVRRWLAGVSVLLSLAACRSFAADAETRADNPTVEYMIVVTGHELLEGVYPDGHTHFLTRTLRPLGLHCVGSLSVDDRAADIRQALQFASGRSRLVIVTGGLGPTDSDITREVLSEFTGVALHEHPDVLQAMEKRFNTPRDQLRANLRRQARVPMRGTYLDNPAGSAVGLLFESGDKLIVALPGPPRELQPMVRDELVPELARRLGTHTTGSSLTVRFVGIGQSQIDQTMKQHIHLMDDVIETSQFEGGRVDFTFALPNDRPEDRARLEQLRREFHEQLGEFIYADDEHTTLEDAVAAQLLKRGERLVLMEIGSAGGLAAGLCRAQAAPQVLGGAWVATDVEQLRRLLGISDDRWQDTADADQLDLLAATGAQHTGSQWALVVGVPQTDSPSSAPQMSAVLRRPDATRLATTHRWPGSTAAAQAQMTTELLDLVRRALR